MSTSAEVESTGSAAPLGVWSFDLPFTTPLSLNDRTHYMTAARERKRWKEATVAAAAGIPSMGRCRITMHYVPRYRRRHDEDNLVASMKPIADGLVEALVVPDDTREFMERVWPVFEEPDSRREGGRIYVTVERLA
jgi:crossover junction endodeoxyribonuclease RusA